ncbi:universal stress protein [Streptomyces sp. NPDC060031]|uniref:universal stress protein n=1 Tax=Streptomyces sp. NPDC060031 TaxID=3347043 RepID=UPI0036C58EF8
MAVKSPDTAKPPRQRPVVVAVDGAPHSLPALDWAAKTARRRGAELLVVHVRPDYAPLGSLRTLPAGAPGHRDAVLAEVQSVLREREGLPPVRYASSAGVVAHTLVALGEHAQVLVLGSRRRGGLASLLLGSTSLACVAEAACPVVVVPPGLRTGTGPARDGRERVVLGLHPELTPQAAIDFAFLEARGRGTALEVVSAATSRRAAAAEEAQGHRLHAFSGGDYRDVEVEPVVVAGAPGARLATGSSTADLVVVGRPRRRLRTGSWPFSSVANSVVMRARCPVAVVPRGDGEAR